MWVASGVSRRKQRPGATMYSGGSSASMARICTGDVWVRSTVRPRSAPAWSTNESVPVTARRVVLADVEGAEVVPVGLHLGALGNLEAESDEHVLEPFPRLGDDVGMTPPRTDGELRQVEPLGLDAAGDLGAGECLTATRDRGGDGVDSLVQELSVRPALVHRGQPTEVRLELGQVAAFAEQLRVEGDDLLDGARSRDLLECRVTCGGDVVDHGESFRLRVVGQDPG